MFHHENELTQDLETFQELENVMEFAESLGVDTSICFGVSSDMETEQLQSMQSLVEEAIEKAQGEAVVAMGRCPCDYAWHKEGSGYRCDGGSHTATLKEIHRHMKDSK